MYRRLSSPHCYILQLFYHVLDKMKRRQVHLDEAWSLKRDKIQVIEGGNEQTKDDTGPVDVHQRAIDPTLPTANCSAENLPQPSLSIDFELLPANCSAELPPPTSNCPEELQPEDIAPIVLAANDLTACDCRGTCCSNKSEVYQPKQMEVLKGLTKKGRNFMISWYNKYPWITLCLTKNKVFCIYCRYAHNHAQNTFIFH